MNLHGGNGYEECKGILWSKLPSMKGRPREVNLPAKFTQEIQLRLKSRTPIQSHPEAFLEKCYGNCLVMLGVILQHKQEVSLSCLLALRLHASSSTLTRTRAYCQIPDLRRALNHHLSPFTVPGSSPRMKSNLFGTISAHGLSAASSPSFILFPEHSRES